MTPEEEKKKKEQTEKITLNRSQVTTHGDKVTETTHQPKNTTRYEQKVSGFINPEDGSVNQAAMDEFERRKQELAAASHVNPETGQVDDKHLSSIFGFDPRDTRMKREDEEELNRSKAKAAAWTNALATLSEMVGAATGSNVWKRDMLNHAQQATEANKALWREQQAEDAQLAAKKQAIEASYADQVQKLHDAVSKAYGTTISKSQETGGNTRSVTRQGNDYTSGSREVTPRGVRGGGSASASASAGAGKGATKILKVQLNDGTNADIRMSAGQHAATGRYLSAMYNALVNSGEEKVGKILSDNGVYPKEVVDKDGNKHYEYNADDLMASGVVFDDPKIRSEFVKAIKNDQTLSAEEKMRITNEMRRYGNSSSAVFKQMLIKMLFGAANTFSGEQADENGNNQPVSQPKKGWTPGMSSEAGTEDLVEG